MARKIKQVENEMKSSTKFFNKKNFFNVTYTSFECLRPVGQLIDCADLSELSAEDETRRPKLTVDIIYL